MMSGPRGTGSALASAGGVTVGVIERGSDGRLTTYITSLGSGMPLDLIRRLRVLLHRSATQVLRAADCVAVMLTKDVGW